MKAMEAGDKKSKASCLKSRVVCDKGGRRCMVKNGCGGVMKGRSGCWCSMEPPVEVAEPFISK